MMAFCYITAEQTIGNRLADHIRPDWDIAIICFKDFVSSQKLVEIFRANPIPYKIFYGMDVLSDPPFVYEASVGEKKVGILTRCLWGGPQAAILVEELFALGVHTIVGFGAAGSVSRALPKRTPIIAQSALVTDGTSRLYAPANNRIQADWALMKVAMETTDGSPYSLHTVTIATVDALFRETKDIIAEWVEMGAEAINMESSTLYTVAASCGVSAIWIGHVSDTLIDEAWDDWTQPGYRAEPNYAQMCWKVVAAILDR